MSKKNNIKEKSDKKSVLDRKSGRTIDVSEVNATVLSEDSPFNVKEAYKSARTNILFSLNNEDDSSKVLMLTSSIPGEGKTLTAINIAIVFAQLGKKVLLIDCDLRKAKLHKYMMTENKVGLSNILGGFNKPEECIKTSEKYGIDYLTAGHTPPNPIELLSSKRMIGFVKDLREKYDFVFLDTPPVNVVSDATILSEMTDGILFVVRHNYTTQDVIFKAKSSFDFMNANVLGFLLNDVDISNYSYTAKMKYGKYKYKNYYSYNGYYY